MYLPTDSVSSFRDGFACQTYRKRKITRSDFLPDGNQVFSVNAKSRKTPNYTFPMLWAKNPIIVSLPLPTPVQFLVNDQFAFNGLPSTQGSYEQRGVVKFFCNPHNGKDLGIGTWAVGAGNCGQHAGGLPCTDQWPNWWDDDSDLNEGSDTHMAWSHWCCCPKANPSSTSDAEKKCNGGGPAC